MQPPTPTPEDVERYIHIRDFGRRTIGRLIETIPREAIEEIGKAIGILRDGTLCFDTEDVSSVLMDCCLFDWIRDGRNLVQRHAESHHAAPGTDDDTWMRAMLAARYSILERQSSVPGAGIHCRDLITGDNLFLMDIATSHVRTSERLVLATRHMPIGEFRMTTGAGLPMRSETIDLLIRAIGNLAAGTEDDYFNDRRFPLDVVRACLADGAGERIQYVDAEEGEQVPSPSPSPFLQRSSMPSRNSPCPCGSGKKFKRCCGNRH